MAKEVDKRSKRKNLGYQVIDEVFVRDDGSSSDDDRTFWFETDYFALKGNPDYLKLMKSLAVLQSQRSKIIEDIDSLEELKSKAAVDPEEVKNFILKGKADFLQRINIEKVPDIDWSKYKTYNPGDRATRRNKSDRLLTVKRETETVDSTEPIKVRGRPYHVKKPETFNQLWTVEEQLRLEALLEEFPPEPIENRRWRKIAAALGNRTTKQVCSRVQKYFAKLQKAGIAAPTTHRVPRTRSNRAAHVHRRHKHLLYKPTTFFPGVAMGELSASDDEENPIGGGHDDLSHWEAITQKIGEWNAAAESEDDEGYTITILHKGFKAAHVHRRHKHLLYKPTTFFPGVAMGELSASDDEENPIGGGHDDLSHWEAITQKIGEWNAAAESEDDEGYTITILHKGFKCNVCGEEPIKGWRWECRSCSSFSACTNCMDSMNKTSHPAHPLTHHFRLFEEALVHPEISKFTKTGNYLDPSYAE